jgi:hypothetical protein
MMWGEALPFRRVLSRPGAGPERSKGDVAPALDLHAHSRECSR